MQLNIEQRKLVTAVPNGGAMLVRGVAGSGKTTVAVHRAGYLLNNYCLDESDRILLVTYNRTLVKYLRYLHDKVNVEEEGYISLFGPSQSQVDIMTIDSLFYRYYCSLFEPSQRRELLFGNSGKKYQVINSCIAELAKKFKHTNILDPQNAVFLLDEIDWIRSCNYMELSEYQNVDRLGRQSYQQAQGPQRLRKNSETRQAIYELMLAFDARLEEEGLIDPKTRDLLVLKKFRQSPEPKYTHIIVDESQDLTRVQLEFLKLLYKPKEYSSLLFVADTAQSIYPHSWLVRGRNFTSLGLDLTGRSSVLNKNYRTTTQIAQAAYSLIEDNPDIVEDEYYVEPACLDKQGEYPVYRHFASEKEEAEYVAREIRRLLDTYQPGEIIVIARLNKQLEIIQSRLEEQGLACQVLKSDDVDFDDDCIKLLTIHSIKGLEFKVVFIIGLNDSVIPYTAAYAEIGEDMQEVTERKLLYVGMTRASERLYLSSSARPSRFIGNISPRYLRLSGDTRFSHMYNIRPDEYLFADRILDIYSKEEKVRQWLLRELQDKYHYPLNLLAVEYRVNNMSRIGSVDVCVQANKNGRLEPFIFCEVKAPGSGVQHALDQLKSYMSNARHCRYGLATDGQGMVIIDADFNPVADIPEFNHFMLPGSVEKYRYHCLTSKQEYTLLRDGNQPREAVVETAAGSEVCTGDRLVPIPAYEGIAAGLPVFMQEKSETRFYLPAQWLRGREDCYLLKVKGDSMIEAGIDDQDYVLVQQQSVAQNRDIVAVALEDEATLKRFMRMGDKILLVPENPKYEPIQLADGQARIMGTVIGVLKRES